MTKFSQPRKFEIYKAILATGEGFILIVSSDEANALNKTVHFCELFPPDAGLNLNSPLNIAMLPEETELAEIMTAYLGNVFPLPKNALVELLGYIRNRNTRRGIDVAIELLFGLRAWVD